MSIVEILGKIGFDSQVALANLVNFLIIVAVVYYFAFKPISKIIDKRQSKIQQGLADAQAAQQALENAEAESEAIKVAASREANELVAEAKGIADQTAAHIISDAEAKAGDIVAKGEKRIAADRVRMESELRAQSADLIVASVEKVLQKNMTKPDRDAYTKQALTHIQGN